MKEVPKRVKVNVTQRDIDRGKRQDEEACPIARAARRVLRKKAVWVGDEAIDWPGGSAGLPPEAQAFIAAFDEAEPVEPFSFELVIEDE